MNSHNRKASQLSNPFHLPGQLGMTVVEMLMFLAALALVVLISVPGSSMLVEYYRLKSATTDLVAGLDRARTEAVNRASTARVCPSSNGQFCRKDGDWSQGWLVFSDGNGDGIVQDIEFLEAYAAPDEHVQIIASGATRTAAAFTLSGLVPDNDSAKGAFILCYGDSNSRSRTILIEPDGWVNLIPADGKPCETG
jgi:type IV fimbrial biogenesis protein FimT